MRWFIGLGQVVHGLAPPLSLNVRQSGSAMSLCLRIVAQRLIAPDRVPENTDMVFSKPGTRRPVCQGRKRPFASRQRGLTLLRSLRPAASVNVRFQRRRDAVLARLDVANRDHLPAFEQGRRGNHR